MRKNLDTLALIGALTMAATPLISIASLAHAEPSRPAQARIFVGDLNFTRTADVAKFRQRVNAAAKSFCTQGDERLLSSQSTCRQAVWAEATEKLGSVQRQNLASLKL